MHGVAVVRDDHGLVGKQREHRIRVIAPPRGGVALVERDDGLLVRRPGFGAPGADAIVAIARALKS